MNHPTVRVKIDDHFVDLDEEIAPLIKAVRKAGIETWQSCQDR